MNREFGILDPFSDLTIQRAQRHKLARQHGIPILMERSLQFQPVSTEEIALWLCEIDFPATLFRFLHETPQVADNLVELDVKRLAGVRGASLFFIEDLEMRTWKWRCRLRRKR